MRFEPHPYQLTAIQHVIDHPQTALFLSMGLGKTISTLTAINELMFEYFEVSRVLVIAPLRVARDTWPEELAKWDHLADLRMAVAVGSPKQRLRALSARADITVINRENVPWLVKHLGSAWPFDMVVLDESSSFKNPAAARFKALKAVRPRISRVVALTGTPASNGLLDLWAQFRLIDEGKRLGKFITHFRDELFTPDKRSATQVFSWKPKPGGEDEIYRRIGDITLSMRTSDHLDLPEVTVVDKEVTLTASVRKAIEELKAEMVLALPGGVVDAANAGVLASKLQQMASGAVYDDNGQSLALHEAKLDALEDLIEAANGQTVLIAAWFKADTARILERFPTARTLTTAKDMTAWKAGQIPIGIIHPASAGHGLNLQSGGHHLIWFTPIWDLELYQQTNARLHRQGQSHPVTIHRIIAKTTIDERIVAALEGKTTIQDNLFEAVKAELKGIQKCGQS